jgi:hypothetical protein
MKALLNRFVNGIFVGLGLLAAVALAPPAFSALSYYTGTGGANPIQGIPATMVDFNNLINSLNSQWFNFATMANANDPGEPQFLNSISFAQNATVATALTSVGPVGSHTTVQKWLTILDNNGAVGFIPVF